MQPDDPVLQLQAGVESVGCPGLCCGLSGTKGGQGDRGEEKDRNMKQVEMGRMEQ